MSIKALVHTKHFRVLWQGAISHVKKKVCNHENSNIVILFIDQVGLLWPESQRRTRPTSSRLRGSWLRGTPKKIREILHIKDDFHKYKRRHCNALSYRIPASLRPLWILWPGRQWSLPLPSDRWAYSLKNANNVFRSPKPVINTLIKSKSQTRK